MTTVLKPVVGVILSLIVVGGVLAIAGEAATPRTIELTIEHSRYLDPDGDPLGTIEVADGETVRFVVHNGDPIAHELIAGDLTTQLEHEAGTDRHHDGAHGAVSVGPGATAETTHTFTGAGTDTATHWVGCHLPRHWDYGMRVPVAVTR